jgi:predicted adenylyl cyclase CyaB
MKNIEVELRGPLNKNQKEKLEKWLEQNGETKEIKDRIVYDYNICFGTVEEGHKSNLDIRLRNTNQQPEIIMKIAKNFNLDSRKEISVPFDVKDWDKMVQVFGELGFAKALIYHRKSKTYDYQDLEFALIEVPEHSYFFEVEKLVHSHDESEQAKQEIIAICAELGLKIWTEDEFTEYVKILNKDANKLFEYNKSE